MNSFNTKSNWKNKIDKLLFVFASLYFIVAIAWLWKQNKQSDILPIRTENAQKEVIVNEIIQNTDTGSESLATEKIANSSVSNNKQLKNLEQQTLIPSIPLPVVEQISTNSSLKIPDLTKNNVKSNTPLPAPSVNINQETQLISTPPPPPLSVVTTSPPKKLNKVPTLNTLNQNQVQGITNDELEPSSSTTVQSKNGEYTSYNYSLIGIVELPEYKSIALFQINNITERVQVGTEIGASGWVLMAVDGQQAVVSRSNKSIYLRVGETF